jgi:hypothetical protein
MYGNKDECSPQASERSSCRFAEIEGAAQKASGSFESSLVAAAQYEELSPSVAFLFVFY